MTTYALPALTDQGLSRYIADVNKFPMLSAEEEVSLARALINTGDMTAAHRLVTSHLRLVVKIASGFRGYGLPVADLIAEGNIGLMQAVKKFDPEKGFRLSTYAMWWIKASINEHVLKSWSLVKMGTSTAQKKLFFNLKRLKRRIHENDSKSLAPNEITQIATELGVSERDVVEMNDRLYAHDASMNRTIFEDGEGEYGDMFADETPTQDIIVADAQERDQRRAMLLSAMGQLNEREQDIVQSRQLTEPAQTLEVLANKYEVSQERIRQIEKRALEKLTQFVLEQQKPLAITAN